MQPRFASLFIIFVAICCVIVGLVFVGVGGVILGMRWVSSSVIQRDGGFAGIVMRINVGRENALRGMFLLFLFVVVLSSLIVPRIFLLLCCICGHC